MRETTIGNLLIDRALPESMRGRARVLDKKGVGELFQELAAKHPEKYRETAKALSDVGREAAYRTGAMSFGPKDLVISPAAVAARDKIKRAVRRLYADASLDQVSRRRAIVDVVKKAKKALVDQVYAEATAAGNPLAAQIASGMRGNKINLASLIAFDGLYTDQHGDEIPVPVLSSYAEGLRPHEFFAGAFGARRGTIDTKLSTQRSGYFSKQLHQVAHRLVVTRGEDDPDEVGEFPRGLPVRLDDPDNVGGLLAHPAGPYPRNTLISPRVVSRLKSLGLSKILVRSPSVGGPDDGGVDARDLGLREREGLSPRGDFVGVSSGQSLGEKLTQGQLCLDLDTEVRMADWTTRKIRDVRPGDMVLGADKTGRTFPVRVVAAHDNGIRAVRRTTFKVGLTRRTIHLDSTADHNILAIINKWSQKAQANNGKLQVVPVGFKTKDFSAVLAGTHIGEDGDDEPFDLAIGLALGDGCYTESVNGAFLSCFDETLPPELASELATLNLHLSRCAGQPGQYRFSQIEQAATPQGDDGRFGGSYRNPMMQYLDAQGMLFKYAHEKTIPDAAYGWSNRSVARLIGGLVVTDGSVYVAADQQCRSKPYIAFSSTSCRMVEQYCELLALRFGIYTSTISGTSVGRKRTQWMTSITTHDGIRRFAAAIPLFGVKSRLLEHHLSTWTVEKPMDHYRCVRKGFEELGSRPTMDLEVDHPDHLFVLANGLVVSNSSKHGGGVVGASRSVGGFDYINALTQAPKIFPGGASHASVDGVVSSVTPAPQGGNYVTVSGERHYAPSGATVKVKPGDRVEAGDVLTDGHPNPSTIVKHKGVGEGRRYFAHAFRDAYNDAGMPAHRRNIELVARGLINHLAVTSPFGDNMPGDVIQYADLEHSWEPREGAATVRAGSAVGQYLEAPVLHHTVGTRVTKSMLPELAEFGVRDLLVHRDPPPFEPTMVRAMANLEHDHDWMTRHLGANIQKGLLDATHRGLESDPEGTSYVPAVADRGHFGRRGLTRAWQTSEIRPIDRDSDGYVFDGTPDERAVDDDDGDDDDE